MKSILLYLLLLVAKINFSQTRLSLSSFIADPVAIVIDNRTYRTTGSERELVFNSIAPGNHTIKIYRQRSSGVWTSGSNRRTQLLFSEAIFLRRGYHLDFIINRFGNVFSDETRLVNRQSVDGSGDWPVDDPFVQPMDATAFLQFKQTLKNEAYDDTRLTIARQGIASNKFTCQQAREIIQLFVYENNKLEIAKFIYSYTIDRNNFMIVYDVFNYSSSREELARFIQQNP